MELRIILHRDFSLEILHYITLRGRKKMTIFYAFFTTFRQFCQIFTIFHHAQETPNYYSGYPHALLGAFLGATTLH